MIVVDASALAAALVVSGERASRLRDRLRGDEAHVPHLVDVEVLSVVRRLVLAGELRPGEGDRAIDRLRRWPLRRHAHGPLLRRAQQLRNPLSSYDATYVALSEIVAAPLVTCDGRLARSHGHGATIEHVAL